MKEDDEEGIGTFLNIQHKSPAMLGDTVCISAKVIRMEGNSIDCEFSIYVGERIVAVGTQGQKILKKDRVKQLIEGLKGG